MARKVTAHLFHSVNGVVESPNEWQFDAFGPEEMQLMGAAIGGITDVVIGRKLWQEWSDYWQSAGADDPFAQFINPVRKHVVTSTLSGDLGWNSTVVEGDPVAFVSSLKDGNGEGGISVVGGIDTIRSLFLGGVVDELTLTTHPVVGVGRRLFDESVPVTRLELVRSESTPAGNAVLTYGLRED
jgi:RNA polymerase sigma-70 factor (ECF subfamily)